MSIFFKIVFFMAFSTNSFLVIFPFPLLVRVSIIFSTHPSVISWSTTRHPMWKRLTIIFLISPFLMTPSFLVSNMLKTQDSLASAEQLLLRLMTSKNSSAFSFPSLSSSKIANRGLARMESLPRISTESLRNSSFVINPLGYFRMKDLYCRSACSS